MNLFSNRSVVGAQNYSSLLRLFLVLLLVASLPVFTWAVLTQRIELRKRASTSEPTQVCWNRVITGNNNRYEWPSGCRGNPRTDLMCTQVLIPLSDTEVKSYKTWLAAGQPAIPGCGDTKPRPTGVIPPGCYYQQVECFKAPCNPILVCPSPSPRHTCTGANGTACTYSDCPVCPPGKMCTMQACRATPGTCQNGTCVATCTPRPTCLEGTPINDGQVYCAAMGRPADGTQYCPPPVPTCIPLPMPHCETINGQEVCAHFDPMPGQTFCKPTPTPTCTQRPSCMDSAPGQPQCMIKMPPGAWFCPPKVTPTPTPINLCSGGNGSACTYTDCPVCTPGTYCMQRACFTINGTCQNGRCVRTSTPTPTPSTHVTSTPTTTPTPTYIPVTSQTMQLRVKLAGVDGAQAEGAKISVKFTTREGVIQQLSSPLTLTHIGSGVYQATAVLSNPFPPGTAFTISVKGEKHIAVRFCRQVGQTAPCTDGEYITVPNPTPLSYGFDFTGIVLPPGDTSPQDGRADQTDIDRIKNLMTKSTSSLTTADKLTGDLNYDGVVNGFDLFLILQTLRTRYDGF